MLKTLWKARRWLASAAPLALALPAAAEIPLRQACQAQGPIPVTAAQTELLTGPEVLNHLPGPSATDFGDRRIGTADDAIHPGLTRPPQPGFSPLRGCPNDLAGGSSNSTVTCGVPGSPNTRPVHGTSTVESQESSLHGTDADALDLSRPGEGAYSFLIAKVGQLESLSYLTGGVVATLASLRGANANLELINVTLGGTTLSPNIFFQGPFNVDLISVGPGGDLAYKDFRRDDIGESVIRGCNGLALGVDGLDPLGQRIDWQPVSPSPFPKFVDLVRSNKGSWNLVADPERGGRLVTTLADTLTKVPTAAGFFVTQNVVINGYLFPIEEVEALLTPTARPTAAARGSDLGDLPDLPGFPGSGKGLARYFVDVLAPKARERPESRVVGFFRGETTVEIIGQDTFLDLAVAAAGRFIDFDMCTLDVRPCTF